MKKDKIKSVRVNGDILKLLEKQNWTAQKLFDWAIAQKVSIKTKIKVKGDKK